MQVEQCSMYENYVMDTKSEPTWTPKWTELSLHDQFERNPAAFLDIVDI